MFDEIVTKLNFEKSSLFSLKFNQRFSYKNPLKVETILTKK